MAAHSLLETLLPKLQQTPPPEDPIVCGPYSSPKVAQNTAARLRKQIKKRELKNIVVKVQGTIISVISCSSS